MAEQSHETHHLPVPVPPRARAESLVSQVRGIAVSGAIAAALLSAMYGVTLHRAADEAAQHQAVAQLQASLPTIFQ